ncbi:MAG TPA: biotin/lipoyl-containing protein [Kofleriaceae bacterium]|nr:biotin/lipoyl-containing protein [Kofleriaceae bacterium]
MKRELVVTTEGREGRDRAVSVEGPLEDGTFRVTIDGTSHQVDARAVRSGTWSLVIDCRSFTVDLDRRYGTDPHSHVLRASVGATEAVLHVEDALHRRLAAAAQPRDKARGETLRAPIAGKVVKLLVAVGDAVAAGSAVIVLEAMKMENELVAERGGTVAAVHKQPGQAVDTGDVLVELI